MKNIKVDFATLAFAFALCGAAPFTSGCGTASSSSSGGAAGPDGGPSGSDGGKPSADGGTSLCSAASCTTAGFACDPEDGQCKPDGKTTNIGAPCTRTGPDPKCGTYAKALCNDLPNDGFPGGYCSVEPCTTAALCPVGASCADLGGETAACYKNCKTDADCRAPDYTCQPMDQLKVSGAGLKVCHLAALPCATPAECPSSLPKCTNKVCKP
jgi:hypothetical protein